MSQPRSVSSQARRRLLLALAAAAAIVPVSGSLRSHRDHGHWLDTLVGDLGRTRRVGEAYLRIHPEDGSVPALLYGVFGFSTVEECLRAGPAVLKGAVRARRSDDFRRGNLVLLDGWAFARTEARLTALVALLPVAAA